MARAVARRGEGRQRVVDAARELFAEHGVSGTSLQMIAEALGVTKAAVYYQFHSKEAIVLAVLEPAVRQLAEAVERAEAQGTRTAQVDTALAGLVDLAVDQSSLVAVLQKDPVVEHVVATTEPLKGLSQRLTELLVGPDAGPAATVAVTVVGRGVLLAPTDPALAHLDEATLRRELLATARAAVRARARAG